MANKPIDKRIGEFKQYNAEPVLIAVEKVLARLEKRVADHDAKYGWRSPKYLRTVPIREVYRELSIFDWWNDDLSISQLRDMRKFLREAIKLGYTGYVCFKVGATGCANGMWANKLPTVNGYSPDCDFLYKSFTPAYNYWDINYEERERGDDRLSYRVGKKFDELTTIKALEEALKEVV